MADTKKVLHISIKKSSHIPAPFLLQILEAGKTSRSAEIMARLVRGEINRGQAFCLMHPIAAISILPCLLIIPLVYIFIQ